MICITREIPCHITRMTASGNSEDLPNMLFPTREFPLSEKSCSYSHPPQTPMLTYKMYMICIHECKPGAVTFQKHDRRNKIVIFFFFFYLLCARRNIKKTFISCSTILLDCLTTNTVPGIFLLLLFCSY